MGTYSDIYSLGATLLSLTGLLTDQLSWDSVLDECKMWRSEFRDVVTKMIAHNSAKRYQTCQEVILALKLCQAMKSKASTKALTCRKMIFWTLFLALFALWAPDLLIKAKEATFATEIIEVYHRSDYKHPHIGKLFHGWVPILKSPHELDGVTEFHVGSCANMTERAFGFISKNLKNLRYLNVEGCHHMTDKGIEYISNLKELSYLNLNSCGTTDRQLAYIAQNLKKLQTLDLRYCRVTNGGLESISNDLKDWGLVTLDLRVCPHITKEALKHISELKHLHGLLVDKSGIKLEDLDWEILKNVDIDIRKKPN